MNGVKFLQSIILSQSQYFFIELLNSLMILWDLNSMICFQYSNFLTLPKVLVWRFLWKSLIELSAIKVPQSYFLWSLVRNRGNIMFTGDNKLWRRVVVILNFIAEQIFILLHLVDTVLMSFPLKWSTIIKFIFLWYQVGNGSSLRLCLLAFFDFFLSGGWG